MAGRETYFVTGTDEHGDKIAEAAQKAGISPKQYADGISAQFRNLWPELAITHDYFIRTTDTNHMNTVRSILQKFTTRGIFILAVMKDITASAANVSIWKKNWWTASALTIRPLRNTAKRAIISSA